MWTAWLIAEAEPEASVAIVEQETCGEGPSGRNGGFVNSMWFSLASMRFRFGAEKALAVADAADAAIDEVGDGANSKTSTAWYRKAGYLQISTTPRHDHVWEENVAVCKRARPSRRGQLLERRGGRRRDSPRRSSEARRSFPPRQRSTRRSWPEA